MSISGIRNSLRRTGFYIPFTLYFFVFVVTATLVRKLLSNSNYGRDTAFEDIFDLLLRVAVLFGAIVITLSFLTVLISFLFHCYKDKNGIVFKISTDTAEGEIYKKQKIQLYLSPVLKPLFGFIKLRLQYDEKNFSDKFSLVENGTRSLFSTTIEGVYHWPLPEIKEYHIQKAILYFEDVFQFFSIAVDLPTNNHFFTQPTAHNINDLGISPRKTEETTTRIEEIRRVEGEFLNYKNFEDNDDVRRIVWKIFAKNKELVVRIPEILDPYASHIHLYSSFFTSFNVEGSDTVQVPFLNYYKIMTWTMYKDLMKRGFDVRFVPDQEVANSNKADEQQWVKYNISTSRWQSDKDLRTYLRTKDASVIIISSLSDPQQVQELMESHGNHIRFIFIKLTDSLRQQNLMDWVQWVFVQHEKDDIEKYKRAWTFSGIRSKIEQNENSLSEIIGKYEGVERVK
jgi:hypothetical protein